MTRKKTKRTRAAPIRNRNAARLAVALLSGQGRTQPEISKILKLGKATVYQLRAEAIDQGWLAKVDVFTADNVPGDLIHAANDLIGGQDLMEPLSEALRQLAGSPVELHICPSGPSADRQIRLRDFGRAAAVPLKDVLVDPAIETVLVAYGSAVRSTIAGLREICPTPPRRKTPMMCLPLRGDAGLEASDMPSALSYTLSQIINGVDQPQRLWRSPTATPPVVPNPRRWGFSPQQARDVLEKYLCLFPDYTDCFGKSAGSLARKAQLIITSIGPPVPVSKITQWIWSLAGFDYSKLAVVGDVAGIPILDHKSPSIQQQERRVAEFESKRLIGATRQDFQELIGERGGKVIVTVMGDKNRARCLLEMVRLRMVSHILVDQLVAVELNRIVK